MASKWGERVAQLRRLWRMPADVAQAEQAAWRASQRLSAELAALAERVDSAEALAGLRQDVAELRDALARPQPELAALLREVALLRQSAGRQEPGLLALGTQLAELQAGQLAANTTRAVMTSELAAVKASTAAIQAALTDELAALKAGAEATRAALTSEAAALKLGGETMRTALMGEMAALHAALEAARLMLGGEIAALQLRVEGARAQLGGQIVALRDGGVLQQAEIARRFHRLDDLSFDQLAILARGGAPGGLRMAAEKPVALDSADHLHPRGTAADDTRHPRFVAACETLFPGRMLHHLDLGCAGGGLVWDFVAAGHESYGAEGSDLSQRSRRAYWRVAPDRFFTADITRPFQLLRGDGLPAIFEIITAWEVLEHIGEADLPGLFTNIRRALTADGVFVASVASFEDRDPVSGTMLHVTLQPRDWWLERAAAYGLRPVTRPVPFVLEDFARGSGNPRMNDWDARWEPSWGFHLMLEAAP